MKRATGIGELFFKTDDPKATKESLKQFGFKEEVPPTRPSIASVDLFRTATPVGRTQGPVRRDRFLVRVCTCLGPRWFGALEAPTDRGEDLATGDAFFPTRHAGGDQGGQKNHRRHGRECLVR